MTSKEEESDILFVPDPSFCPVCGLPFRDLIFRGEQTETFICPLCQTTIKNKSPNRCYICQCLFDNSGTLSDHMYFDHPRSPKVP
jgi:hypothetical protein